MRAKDRDAYASVRRVKIRHTRKHKNQSGLRFGRMTRAEALGVIQKYLKTCPVHPLAHSLIDLFQLHGEELTEAGIPYETVKALEQKYPLLTCLNE